MPRTKAHKKSSVSVRSTVGNADDSVTSRMNRISAIASIPHSTGVENVNVHTSTPVEKNKKKIFKEFISEMQEDHKIFELRYTEDIKNFREKFEKFQREIPRDLLRSPLKSSIVYWKSFASVSEADLNNLDDNNIAIQMQSAEKFKKPDVTTTNLIQTAKRITRSRVETPHNPIPCTPSSITPKVNMNEPLSVVRYAKMGEQALSMSGSPIMVTSVPREDIATVSVPLHDGTVVTILPTSKFQRKQMPTLDNDTKEQLENLYRNLAVFFEDDES